MRYKASEQQLQYWLQNQIQPDNPAYNVTTVTRVHGRVDRKKFEAAFAEVVSSVPVWNITFLYENAVLFCVPSSTSNAFLEIRDGRGPGEGEVNETLASFASSPFDLSQGPLVRGLLLQTKIDESWFVFVSHHSVNDLHTINMFRKAFSKAYNGTGTNGDTDVPIYGRSYSQYVDWYESWSKSDAFDKATQFWREQCAGVKDGLDFPFDYPRKQNAVSVGKIVHIAFDSELMGKVEAFCASHTSSPFLVLLAAYALLLKKYSNQNEFAIGMPLTNRVSLEHQEIAGCLMNILPLCVAFNASDTFLDVLAMVRKKVLLSHRYQSMPFTKIVEAVKPPRVEGRNAIFQTLFTFEDPIAFELNGLTVEDMPIHTGGAQLDFSMVLRGAKDGIRGRLEYATGLMSEETAIRVCTHYQHLLSAVLSNPAQKVSALSLLTPVEKQQILGDWNKTHRAYPTEFGLHSLIELQVARTPHAIALEMDGQSPLTYQEFNFRCNRLAHYLIKAGVQCGNRIGVYLERSVEMVVALHAIEKAGGVYVPLEPDFPEVRIHQMIEDADIHLVISMSHRCPPVTDLIRVICLDQIGGALAESSVANTGIVRTGSDDSYIIFTSGSTGRPKGVLNHHGGICNRIHWMQEAFPLGPEDAVLLKTPFTFDVSVWEFFWPLMSGARLVVAPPGAHKDPVALCDLIKKYHITTIHFVPSMLDVFLGVPHLQDVSTLRRVICSGEALGKPLHDKFFALMKAELHNLYGPTEAAVDVTHWKCEKSDTSASVPIGRPIANTSIYILDEDLNPVPVGVTGELLIGGVQVAHGYVNRDELTNEKFIPDPFGQDSSCRMYKTGDSVRFLADGNIEYLGRMDGQVKLHGLRIELEEINTALVEESEVVQQAVTIVSQDGADVRLVAYVVVDKTSKFVESSIRERLARRLPQYMIPGTFICIDEIPLSSNGKVDRKQLPSAQSLNQNNAIGQKAASKKEHEILEIWKEILQLDDIGIDRKFFDIGGTSILAAHLTNRLNTAYCRSLNATFVFTYPSIREQSRYLESNDFESPTAVYSFKERAERRKSIQLKRRPK